jgi:hypothetical protein
MLLNVAEANASIQESERSVKCDLAFQWASHGESKESRSPANEKAIFGKTVRKSKGALASVLG